MRYSGMVCAGVLVSVCALTALGAQVNWTGAGSPNNRWFVGGNWDLGIPQLGQAARDAASQVIIIYDLSDQGAADNGILSFEGVISASQTRAISIAASSVLTATGNVFRSGSGSGTYTIQVGPDGALRVGDPSPPHFGGPFDADLYGFNLRLQGDPSVGPPQPAVIHVTHRLGWGPLDISGGKFGSVTAGVAGNSSFPGAIDCAFAGQGNPQVDPVANSRWIVGNATTGNQIVVVSDKIVNVGYWDIHPFSAQFSQIVAREFRAWPTDGQLRLGGTRIFITGPVGIVNFSGTSQLLEYNDPFLSSPGNELFLTDAALEFSSASALLRPDSYPAASVEFVIRPTDSTIDVQTRVGHPDQGLLWDTSFTTLQPAGADMIESFTPDVCNVLFVDQLYEADVTPPNPSFYSCTPKRNRCAKYWADIDGDNATVDLADTVSNQAPDYAPVGLTEYGLLESAYFCKITGVTFGEGDRAYGFDSGIPLIETRYGDFQGDFDVDLQDYARFANAFTGPGGVTWHPLADWGVAADNPEPDCDADLDDYTQFYARWQSTVNDVIFVCAVPPPPATTEPPLPGSQPAHGNVKTIVCGGPLHTPPEGAPGLSCPDICAYNPTLCDGGGNLFGGGGQNSMMGPNGGEGGGGSDAPPGDTASPAELAAWLTAHLSAAERAQVAESMLADTAEPDVLAVGALLAGS